MSSQLLAAAVLCALACVAVGLFAASAAGVQLDRALLRALQSRQYSSSWDTARRFDDNVPSVAVAIVILVEIVLLAQRQWRRGFAVAACLTISVGLAEAAKRAGLVKAQGHLLAVPGPSWPSVHSVVVTAFGGALLLVVQDRKPRLVLGIVSAVIAAASGVALLVTGAHRLTDIVGGMLLASAVCCAVASWLAGGGATDRPLNLHYDE